MKVHYNSPKPSQVEALAYAQGSDIHVGPGQEKHLPHEAWHVAQQKRGKVSPTMKVNGLQVNDDSALEREADIMGAKANRSGREHESRDSQSDSVALQGGMHTESKSQEYVVQRRVGYEFEAQWNVRDVSDMEQAETVKEVAKSERERTVHVELAKRLARQPNNTGPFTVTFNEDELGENEQER